VTDFLLSQLLVGVVFCFDVASFQFREKRHVLSCLVFSALLLGIHFALLGAQTAAILGFIAAARFSVAIFSHARWWMYLFLSLVIVNGILSYAGLLTLFATVGGLITTTAAFMPTDRQFREYMMVGTLVWIAHNAMAGSPAAVVLEIFFLGSNLVGYYRFYLR
jgi:hypothetical protein